MPLWDKLVLIDCKVSSLHDPHNSLVYWGDPWCSLPSEKKNVAIPKIMGTMYINNGIITPNKINKFFIMFT